MGLPLHPLVVHAATVLLPLSLLGLVLAVLVPRLRPRLAGLSVVGLVGGAVAAWVAEETGESLADQVGVAQDHARYGGLLPPLAVVALLVGAGWWWLQRGQAPAWAPAWATGVAGAGVVATAAVTAVLTVLAGHSGAASVWDSRTAAAVGAAEAGQAATGATARPAPSAAVPNGTASSTAAGYTMADVAAHAGRSDCWSAVDGQVYDLTRWIARHPGGPGTIAGMCGTDASAAFRGKHGTKAGPSSALAEFALGPLADAGTSGGQGTPGATAGATGTPAPPSAAAAPTTRYTRAEVARHGSTADCWSTLNGKVYDLTQWVSRHPGGSEAIAEMCGGPGGEFLEQHAGDPAAEGVLAGYQVGVLG